MYKKYEDIFEKINEISSSRGNEALYNACAGADICDTDVLAGMMWLIGRSYAASPQRRSYGMSRNLEYKGYNKKGEKYVPIKRPIWRVRTENSGNGDFFLKLAEGMKRQELCGIEAKDTPFDEMMNVFNELKKCEYNFTVSDGEIDRADFEILVNSIKCVSMLNRLVKRSTELFDKVPKDHKHEIRYYYLNDEADKEGRSVDYVYCKNQVSFCSKFLHFFHPNTVFIIDQFSKKGGEFLFDAKSDTEYDISDGLVEVLAEPNSEADASEEGAACGVTLVKLTQSERKVITDDYSNLLQTLTEDLRKKLKSECERDSEEIVALRKNKGVKEAEKIKSENYVINDYINHCAASYILCLMLKEKYSGIIPKKSYPRLSDTIFMRIKKQEGKSEVEDDKYYK